MFRLIVIGIISTFLLIPIAGYSSNIIKNEIALIAASVVTGYMIVPAILLQIWKSKDFDIGFETMEKALIRGKLQTTEFSVSEVIEIEEFEDEGDHYLFSVGDNKTLSLFGQYLYEYKERNDFPSTIIRVFSNKESKVVYGIECAGEPVQVSKVLESPVPEAWKAGIVPIDNDLVNKSLSDILREIDNYA